MINIYSIKEVIEASNNILNRKDNKTGLTSSKKSISKKNFVLTKDKPLVLTDEVSNKSNFRESQKKISNKKRLKGNTSPIKSIRKNKLIDQLYFKFNKKVKKIH